MSPMNEIIQPTNYFESQSTNSVRSQQISSKTDFNGSQNNGIAQLAESTQGFVPKLLANEIKNAVNLNLPEPYTYESPDVQKYIQQLIATVGVIYRNQVKNVHSIQ